VTSGRELTQQGADIRLKLSLTEITVLFIKKMVEKLQIFVALTIVYLVPDARFGVLYPKLHYYRNY
jgi:hypothetical protein